MTRWEVVRLVAVALVGCSLVIALAEPRGSVELATGGYAVAANVLLPPRAQPSAPNVHHSSSELAT